MAHDVFISHSNIDRAVAHAACATFEQNGIRCWIAPRDVPAGSEWAEAIIDAIEKAKVMVLIFSTHSNESRQVRREIELAVSRGITIMPLRMEKIEPTRSMAYYMAGVHWIDALSPPLDKHFRQMVEWIRPHVGGRAQPEPPPRAEPKPAQAEKPKAGAAAFAPMDAAHIIDGARDMRRDGRVAESIAAYRQVIARIGEPQGGMNNMLALALGGLALSHEALEQWTEALAAYEELLRRYRNTSEPYLRERVAMALVNRGFPLNESKRYLEALESYDEFTQRFGTAKEEVLVGLQGRVAHNRGIVLSDMGRNQDAIGAYDAAARRYEGSTDPALAEIVAMSIYNRSVILNNMDRVKEAIGGCDDIIRRYASHPHADLKRQVEMAREFRDKMRAEVGRR
jgi:tetratricopeptide (TPR) repeat protein